MNISSNSCFSLTNTPGNGKGRKNQRTVPLGVNQKRRVGNSQTGHRMWQTLQEVTRRRNSSRGLLAICLKEFIWTKKTDEFQLIKTQHLFIHYLVFSTSQSCLFPSTGAFLPLGLSLYRLLSFFTLLVLWELPGVNFLFFLVFSFYLLVLNSNLF